MVNFVHKDMDRPLELSYLGIDIYMSSGTLPFQSLLVIASRQTGTKNFQNVNHCKTRRQSDPAPRGSEMESRKDVCSRIGGLSIQVSTWGLINS